MTKSLGKMIALVSRHLWVHVSDALKPFNLTAGEEPFFMALLKNDGIMQEELTKIVCVDKAVTARVMKSLEEKGFIRRVQDENDRRQKRIYLMDDAKNLEQPIINALLSVNEKMTKGIPDKDYNIAYNSLLKIDENLIQISSERKK